MVDRMDGLHLGCMSQHLAGVHVAYGIDVRNCGLQMFIDGNTRAFGIVKTCMTEMVKHARRTTYRHEHIFCFNRDGVSFFVGEHHPIPCDGCDATLHVEGDTLFFQRLAQTLGNIRVEHRQALLQKLHHRHFCAKRIENTSKLHADDTSTYNTETLGLTVDRQQVGRIEHSSCDRFFQA